MFVEERLEKIISIIKKEKKVKVDNLSEMFGVSKDLIRKDLTKLEEAGLLKKTYGGAIKVRKKPCDITISSRMPKDIEVKIPIAKKALEQIKELETVFLDLSSMNYILAQEILKKNMNITIITNMIDIMHLFSEGPTLNTKLIGIGGVCNKIIGGYVGVAAIEQLKHFNIDRCFIGTDGINILNGNVTTYEQEDGLTKYEVLKLSKVKNLITEKLKLNQDGLYIFSNLSDFDNLIIDDMSNEVKESLESYNLNVI